MGLIKKPTPSGKPSAVSCSSCCWFYLQETSVPLTLEREKTPFSPTSFLRIPFLCKLTSLKSEAELPILHNLKKLPPLRKQVPVSEIPNYQAKTIGLTRQKCQSHETHTRVSLSTSWKRNSRDEVGYNANTIQTQKGRPQTNAESKPAPGEQVLNTTYCHKDWHVAVLRLRNQAKRLLTHKKWTLISLSFNQNNVKTVSAPSRKGGTATIFWIWKSKNQLALFVMPVLVWKNSTPEASSSCLINI